MSTFPQIVFYRLNKNGQNFIESWLSGQIETTFHSIKTFAGLEELPAGPRIILTGEESSYSVEMTRFFEEQQVSLIINADRFLRLFDSEMLRRPRRYNIFLVDDIETRFHTLQSVLSWFGGEIHNPPLRRKISHWSEIPDFKKVDFALHGLRPVFIVNLDSRHLDLRPFIQSLNESRFKRGREEIHFRPRVIPVKDFSQGFLWDDVTSGIRQHSRAIFSWRELVSILVDMFTQAGLQDLNQRQAADGRQLWNHAFRDKKLADLFDVSDLYHRPDELHKKNITSLGRLEHTAVALNHLLLFKEGFRWYLDQKNDRLESSDQTATPKNRDRQPAREEEKVPAMSRPPREPRVEAPPQTEATVMTAEQEPVGTADRAADAVAATTDAAVRRAASVVGRAPVSKGEEPPAEPPQETPVSGSTAGETETSPETPATPANVRAGEPEESAAEPAKQPETAAQAVKPPQESPKPERPAFDPADPLGYILGKRA